MCKLHPSAVKTIHCLRVDRRESESARHRAEQSARITLAVCAPKICTVPSDERSAHRILSETALRSR